MIVEESPSAQRAPAKGRILDTANVLFYEDGIRNVGVDRIIAASSVTKATFYKHYRAKDNLIVEYMAGRHRAAQAELEHLIATSSSPDAALRAFVTSVSDEISSPGFRGCAFINAAAENEAGTPVHDRTLAHKTAVRAWVRELAAEAGAVDPERLSRSLTLLLDGGLASGSVDGLADAPDAAKEAAEALVRIAVPA